MTRIGTPVTLIDAMDKVTGRLKFGSDYKVAGMLYGKVLKEPDSPRPDTLYRCYRRKETPRGQGGDNGHRRRPA